MLLFTVLELGTLALGRSPQTGLQPGSGSRSLYGLQGRRQLLNGA